MQCERRQKATRVSLDHESQGCAEFVGTEVSVPRQLGMIIRKRTV